MRLSNLFTVLLKEIVNSAKKVSMFEEDGDLYTLMQNHFIRYGYFSADCLTEICFKIFMFFRNYSFLNVIMKSTLPASDSREILHFVNPTQESGNYDSAVLHFGVNDLLHKAIIKSDTVDNLMENIRKAAEKCMSHGVSKVCDCAK